MAKIQRTDADCSVGALQNALSVYGRSFGYGRLAKLLGGCVGPGEDGADQNDILVAVSSLGHPWDELDTSRRSDAREWLRKYVPVAPVILCVDDWGHWVTVAGVCRQRICLHDSLKEPHNTAWGGTHWLKVDTVMRRWRASRKRKKEGGLYYGIAMFAASTAAS